MRSPLIVGDFASGKTTLAQKISSRLKINWHSTDDFFWKVKFPKKSDPAKSKAKLKRIFARKSWIMEGTTRVLIEPGLSGSDFIIYVGHKLFLDQYFVLIQRAIKRGDNLIELLDHMAYLFSKKHGLNKSKKESLLEMLVPHKNKLIELHSFREIDSFLLKSFKK